MTMHGRQRYLRLKISTVDFQMICRDQAISLAERDVWYDPDYKMKPPNNAPIKFGSGW